MMSRNAYFLLCIGLSVVAVFLFGFYSIRSHLALPAQTGALPDPAQQELKDAFDAFRTQSAESMGLLKGVLSLDDELGTTESQKQSDGAESASSISQ